MLTGSCHISGGEQAGVLQAQAFILRVLPQRLLQVRERLLRLLDQQYFGLKQYGLGLVGLHVKQRVEFIQRLLELLELSVDQGLGQQQRGIFREFDDQLIDTADQYGALSIIQCGKAIKQSGEVRRCALALHHGQVGQGVNSASLMHQQGGQGTVCLHIVGVQLDP